MRTVKYSTVIVAIMISATIHASGQLDPRFDGDGIRVINAAPESEVDDYLVDGLIDHAGRIVAAGRWVVNGSQDERSFVLRTLRDGTLDAGFGDGGIAQFTPPPGFAQLRWVAMAEQADGKLVMAGELREPDNVQGITRAYVCRMLGTGVPDPGFGDGGCVQPSFWPDSNRDWVIDMALQGDGRIVLIGTTDAGDLNNYVVTRLNVDGSLDRCLGDVSCSSGGLLIEPEPPADLPNFVPHALALAPDGRIVIAGQASGFDLYDMAVIRLMPTGEVDQGFGNGGHRLVDFAPNDSDFSSASAVVVSPNGDVLLAGSTPAPGGSRVAVAALDAYGDLVPAFSNDGRATLYFNDVSPSHKATSLHLQADGKLLVTGFSFDLANGEDTSDCSVARLLPSGELDPKFGINGKLNIDGGLGLEPLARDQCQSSALNERSVVLFGVRQPNGSNYDDTMLIKLDQDDLFVDGFEAND